MTHGEVPTAQHRLVVSTAASGATVSGATVDGIPIYAERAWELSPSGWKTRA